MGVVGREDRPHFEVADDGQVNEKAEYARTDKVPEADRHEEIERPPVGDQDLFSADVAPPVAQLYEVPRIQSHEGEWDDFHGGKHS